MKNIKNTYKTDGHTLISTKNNATALSITRFSIALHYTRACTF